MWRAHDVAGSDTVGPVARLDCTRETSTQMIGALKGGQSS